MNGVVDEETGDTEAIARNDNTDFKAIEWIESDPCHGNNKQHMPKNKKARYKKTASWVESPASTNTKCCTVVRICMRCCGVRVPWDEACCKVYVYVRTTLAPFANGFSSHRTTLSLAVCVCIELSEQLPLLQSEFTCSINLGSRFLLFLVQEWISCDRSFALLTSTALERTCFGWH